MDKIFENWRRYLEEGEQKEVLTEASPAALAKKAGRGLKSVAKDVKSVAKDVAAGTKKAPQMAKDTAKSAALGAKERGYLARGRGGEQQAKMKAGDISTLQDLADLLGAAKGTKTAKGVEKKVAKQIFGAIPGGTAAKSLGDFLRKAYFGPDKAKTRTALDVLNVDDKLSNIVSDEIEDEFLDAIQARVDQFPREKWPELKIASLNMDDLLRKYLSDKYEKRTVVMPKGAEKHVAQVDIEDEGETEEEDD